MTEQTYTIRLQGAQARNPELRLKSPVNLSFGPDEQIALVGCNGSGKSLLVNLITGASALLDQDSVSYDFSPSPSQEVWRNLKYIAFRDTYGTQDTNYYYQQRWNATEQEEFPFVGDLLSKLEDSPLKERLYELFQIEGMLSKRILALSSGEMRKYQLTKVLLSAPRIMIMDNPFIGLDKETRELLKDLLGTLGREWGIQFILVLSSLTDIPEFITHVVEVRDGEVREKVSREEYLCGASKAVEEALRARESEIAAIEREILALEDAGRDFDSKEVIKLNKVTVRYGEHVLLRDLDWTVEKGQRWALKGRNGSGKSTLISLICADNPQSYACDISLFGRKRGTGESIWEIKKHIGYVSPEMHRAYLKNLPAVEIVASGLFDSVGLYVKPRPEQIPVCRFWMHVMGIEQLSDRPFLTLSSGEQRLVLLARAFVKDPELLILDEPLHGLDTLARHRVRRIIETFSRRSGKTLLMVTHYQEELPDCFEKMKELVKPQ